MLDAKSLSTADLNDLVAHLGLVDPTDTTTRRARSAPRLTALAGRRIGLLDNRKPNAALLLAELARLLDARFGLSEVASRAKFIYSRPAAPDVIDELAGYDAVITAIGD